MAPLAKGTSKKVVGNNVAELIRAGYRTDQAAAIAYKKAGKYRKGVGAKVAGIKK